MARLHLEPSLTPASLRSRAARASSPQEALQWQALSLVAQGRSGPRIAAELGISVASVRNWVRRYNERGPGAPLTQRTGRPSGRRLLSAEQQAELTRRLAEPGPAGGPWTPEQVATLLGDWLGRPILPSVARRYLPRRRRTAVVRSTAGPRRFQPPLPAPEGSRPAYPSDLTDAEWAAVAPLLARPPRNPTRPGRPCTWSKREILNGIFYVVRSGEAWRMLPHDLPPWSTVYGWFRTWRRDGTWEGLNQVLRERVRVAAGREPEPSAAILDSQSAKTTEKGGLMATTRARRSTAASATCWSTPWACC